LGFPHILAVTRLLIFLGSSLQEEHLSSLPISSVTHCFGEMEGWPDTQTLAIILSCILVTRQEIDGFRIRWSDLLDKLFTVTQLILSPLSMPHVFPVIPLQISDQNSVSISHLSYEIQELAYFSTVTRLWTGQLRNLGSIPEG
jgi:hypothetical protein